MEREKDSMRPKEGQAGGGGWMALITSARAQRHCTNYGPRLSLRAHFAFLIRFADFCQEQGELGTHHTGACPRDEQPEEHRPGSESRVGWIRDIGCLCGEQRKCFLDGQTPVLMGSYCSELCRRPGQCLARSWW